MFNKIFTEIIKSKFIKSFLVGFFFVVLYHFVVFPGLTIANTMMNVLSFITGVFGLVFLFFYIRFVYFKNESFELFTPDPKKEPETELDFNPDLIPRKERKPKVKTKTKKQKK